MPRHSLTSLRCAAVFIVCLLGATASAQTIIDWADPSDGNYNFVFEWNPLNVPDNTSESARFNVDGAYGVFHFGNTTVSDLLVLDGDVTFTRPAVAGGASTYTMDDDAVIESATLTFADTFSTEQLNLDVGDELGVAEGGMLNITDGHTVTANTMRVGAKDFGAAGQVGRVTVDGAGSRLTVDGGSLTPFGASSQTGELVVSGDGRASFTGALHLAASANSGVSADVDVLSGGNVSVNGALNVVTGANTNQSVDLLVSGSGSNFTVQGDVNLATGTSTMQTATTTIADLAQFTQRGAGFATTIGGAAEITNSSVVTVESGGAFTTSTGAVNVNPTGELNVAGGAFTANGPMTVAPGAMLTLSGGQLEAAAGLDAIESNSLDLSDGELVLSGGSSQLGQPGNTFALDGADADDVPTLRVTNQATATIGTAASTGQPFVGVDRKGAVVVEDGATLNSDIVRLGFNAGSQGDVTVTGAGTTWIAEDGFIVGSVGHGTLRVEGGATVDGGFNAGRFTAGSSGEVTVTGTDSEGNPSTITSAFGMTIGNQGAGTLAVEAGGQVVATTAASIGSAATSVAMATVTGADAAGNPSAWTAGGSLTIGRFGDADLTIEQGGSVATGEGRLADEEGSTGDVVIAGIDAFGNRTTWDVDGDLLVGVRGAATISVQAGALLANTGFANVGVLQTGDATVTVTGADASGVASTWTSENLNIGQSGSGRLDVLAGGKVTGVLGRIGQLAGDGTAMSRVRVSGDDALAGASSLTLTSSLDVGVQGDAQLLVEDGGQVSNTDGFVASSTSSESSVTVTGDGSLWDNTDELFVGGNRTSAQGTGTLTVADGGEVRVANTLKVWSTGTINLDGGTLSAPTLDDTDGGTFNMNGGTLSVDAFRGDLAPTDGVVSPGDSPGVTAVDGAFSPGVEATLLIEIGGVTAETEFDLLTATGAATLQGALDVELIDGFTPSVGDAFEFLTADGGVSGVFSSENLPAISDELALDVVYGASSVTLSVVFIGLAGDYNDDGVVDAADYTVWRDNEGAAAGTLPNDSVGGVIGAAQYDAWRDNFGATVGVSVAVPEPGLVLLVAVVSLGATRLRLRI